ncbi:uncharacterized protein LOC127249151 [Andrographis paniculata]|uniref:uncharacterized protein LOC127249151 n=1 Tax=Andrographis paniculata TaxID=175694 RepID=UPI0021E89916|nr:uncharacterized protein LOC127249151 [Andrographis paniculata]
MRILQPPSSRTEPHWSGSRPAIGLLDGCCFNLCSILSSCFYVFCCCWLLEDCFAGRRTFPGAAYGSPPPPRSGVMAGHVHVGHDFGPGPIGYQGGPPPPPPPRHGLLGPTFGPSSVPGPAGYQGEPSPF